MALKMTSAIKANAEVALISKQDDAIDWEVSYPDCLTLEEKFAEHGRRGFDAANVTLREGGLATVLIFRDPRLSTVASEVKAKITGIKSVIAGEGKVSDDEIAFTVLALGYREGGGDMITFARDREKKIAQAHIQPLHEAGVIAELGGYLLTEILAPKSASIEAQKK